MNFDYTVRVTPRKVAFVLPAYRAGGMEISMFRIAGYFKQSGWHVTMVATEDPGEWFRRISELGHQPILMRKFCKINMVGHAVAVGQYLAAENFDLIFTVFDRFSQAAMGWVKETTKVVPLLRNDHPDVYEIGLANSRCWNVAVGNSPKICNFARKLEPHKNVLLIPNGVSVAPYRARNWGAGTVLKLLFVGRLVHDSKRVLLLPKVMRIVRDLGIAVQLQIAGDGPDREELQHRISDLKLDDCCELLGHVNEPQLGELYDAAHALLFISVHEGLPNVLLEAMARGCVPISTRLSGSTDYLIDHGSSGYLVDIDDIFAIVESIKHLATAKVGGSLSRMARRNIQSRFSTDIESASFMKMISELDKGRYQISRPRRAFLYWRLFNIKYIYRRIIKPFLVPVYTVLKRIIIKTKKH